MRRAFETAGFVDKATGLTVYRDPRSGALLWVDVRELRLRFTLSVNKLEKFVEGM